MTTRFRLMRATALSVALLAPIASVALADTPAKPQADSSGGRVAQRPNIAVVPNNGLCNAQDGVPMAGCDTPQAKQPAKSGAPNGIDYHGFPYSLGMGG
jgi:hypothetical protein